MISPTSFCGTCGKLQAQVDDRFCRACGAPIGAVAPVSTATDDTSEPRPDRHIDANPGACLGCGYPSAKIAKWTRTNRVFCPMCHTRWGVQPNSAKGRWVDHNAVPLSAILVREYASQQEFQNDAVKLRAGGYDVLSVNERNQNAGCLRILTLGLLALVVRPTPHIVVTYQRH